MSGGPKDASIAGNGFRWYEWAEEGKEPIRVLSVTSIRKLCGEPFNLVMWQIANIVNAATGMTKRIKIGPRGGRQETYVSDGWKPGESLPPFVKLLSSAETQKDLDAARAWLQTAGERPRDTAAIRGTIVHESIELNVATERIDEDYMIAAVDRLSARDRTKVKKLGGITDDDVAFVKACNAQFWDMRLWVPFVILAKEPQVWNLTAGYAGSADVLLWFLGDFDAAGRFTALPGMTPSVIRELQRKADKGQITQALIAETGGHVTLGDWKTAKGVYTDNVVQVTAYLAAEFVGSNGVIDQRLTDILTAAAEAAIIHIRPDGWSVHFVNFETHVLRAFLGSVAFARFLATYQEPTELFTYSVSGAAELETE